MSGTRGLNNNVLVVRQWNPIYFTTTSSLSITRWNAALGRSVTTSLAISLFTPSGRLKSPRFPENFAVELNSEAELAGLPVDLFDFGSGSVVGSPITLTMKYPGYIFMFDGMPIDVLGINKSVPITGFFKGKSGSFAEYRYMSNERDPNKGQIFRVSLTPGVRWLEEVLYEIRKGLVENNHATAATAPNTIDLFSDAEGFIYLQIRRPGFQVVFNGNSSIANYLGFEDLKNFPCNPAVNIGQCSASDVVNNSCATSLRNGSSVLWCGVTQGTDIYQKRGAVPRPFVSRFTASGQCRRQDNYTGKCVCSQNAGSATVPNMLGGSATVAGSETVALCALSMEDPSSSRPRQVAEGAADAFAGNANSVCSCAVKTHFHRQDGNRPWGVFQEHRIEFKDGIYDLALLNQAVNETLTAKGFDSETLPFFVVGIRVRL